MNQHYQPKGIEIIERTGDVKLYVTEGEFKGWICYKHPDGQWVTLRNATPEDLKLIAEYCRSREAWYYEQSYFEDSAIWEGYARTVEATNA